MDDSRLFERTVSSAIQYSRPVFDVYRDTVELCTKRPPGGIILNTAARWPWCRSRIMAA